MIYIEDDYNISKITYDRDSRIIIDSKKHMNFELSVRYFEKTNKISYMAIDENRKKTTVLLSAKKDLYIQMECGSLTFLDKPHMYGKYFVLSTRGVTRIDKRKVNHQVLSSKICIGSTDEYPMHIEKYCDNLRVRYSDGTAVLLRDIEPGYIYLINTHKRYDECNSSSFIAPKSRTFNSYNIVQIHHLELKYNTEKFRKITNGLYGVFLSNFGEYIISHKYDRVEIRPFRDTFINPTIGDMDIFNAISMSVFPEKTKYAFYFNMNRAGVCYTYHKDRNTLYQLYFHKNNRNTISFGEVEWTTICKGE